jgi:Cu+-exporting ATPase
MKVRDPLCGREIDLADAVASEFHDGWAYFFCSTGCLETFRSSPDRFSEKPGVASVDARAGNTGKSR